MSIPKDRKFLFSFRSHSRWKKSDHGFFTLPRGYSAIEIAIYDEHVVFPKEVSVPSTVYNEHHLSLYRSSTFILTLHLPNQEMVGEKLNVIRIHLDTSKQGQGEIISFTDPSKSGRTRTDFGKRRTCPTTTAMSCPGCGCRSKGEVEVSMEVM